GGIVVCVGWPASGSLGAGPARSCAEPIVGCRPVGPCPPLGHGSSRRWYVVPPACGTALGREGARATRWSRLARRVAKLWRTTTDRRPGHSPGPPAEGPTTSPPPRH